MSASLRSCAILIAGLFGLASSLGAQSLQRVSLQVAGSALYVTSRDPSYTGKSRIGFEAQGRYTFGRLSLGAGYQRSTVYPFREKQHSLLFLEPKYVATTRGGVALYLVGRLGLGSLVCRPEAQCRTQTTYGTFGGGSGLLIRLNRRMSADLGAQFLQVTGIYSSAYVMLRAGLGIGL